MRIHLINEKYKNGVVVIVMEKAPTPQSKSSTSEEKPKIRDTSLISFLQPALDHTPAISSVLIVDTPIMEILPQIQKEKAYFVISNSLVDHSGPLEILMQKPSEFPKFYMIRKPTSAEMRSTPGLEEQVNISLANIKKDMALIPYSVIETKKTFSLRDALRYANKILQNQHQLKKNTYSEIEEDEFDKMIQS